MKRKQLRIAVGQKGGGWFPSQGLVIDVDGEDWVVESVGPDPDAVWYIDTIHRWASRTSLLVHVRRATAEESAQSADQERQDSDEFVASMMR